MNTTFRFILLVGLFWLRSITPSLAHGNDNPTGVTGDFNGSIQSAGNYDPLTGNEKRIVNDITIGCVGEYPLKWTRTSNSRSAATGGAFGQGGPWQHSYNWKFDGALNFTTPDGRVLPFTDEPYGTGVFMADVPRIPEKLEVVTWNATNKLNGEYNLLLPDGGKVCFRRVTYINGSTGLTQTSTMVTKLVDPYGLETNFTFMADGRLWKITEPGGRYLQINYTTQGALGSVVGLTPKAGQVKSVVLPVVG